mgnify:CR=1 FL=1
MTKIGKMFKTDLKKESLLLISAEELKEMGIKAITLDADNTSSYDRTTNPIPGAKEWVDSIKNAGIKVILLSNAKKKRAIILADQYEIPVIGLSCKPLPFGYIRAVLKLRVKPSEICMVGDQLFTDIMGANLMGFKSIYCYPIAKEKQQAVGFAIKRFGEKIVFYLMDKGVL